MSMRFVGAVSYSRCSSGRRECVLCCVAVFCVAAMHRRASASSRCSSGRRQRAAPRRAARRGAACRCDASPPRLVPLCAMLRRCRVRVVLSRAACRCDSSLSTGKAESHTQRERLGGWERARGEEQCITLNCFPTFSLGPIAPFPWARARDEGGTTLARDRRLAGWPLPQLNSLCVCVI